MNITVLLQGYSSTPEQLKEDVEYYKSLGLNVIVSSYSKCTKLLSKEIIINNDEGNGISIRDGFQGNNLNKNKSSNFEIVTNKTFFRAGDYNLNFQIHTTKAGLTKIKKIHPNTEYILKLRADMKLYDIPSYAREWIKNSEIECDFLNKKIVTKGHPGISGSKKWKVYDFWTFGTAQDIYKYFDIPYTTSKIAPEFYLTQYIRNNCKESWDEAKYKYFHYDHIIPTYWHKYEGWLDTSKEKGYVGIYPRHIIQN